jgi:hypothetical protein
LLYRRAKKAQEASAEAREQQRQAMQREQKTIDRPTPAFEDGPLLDPIDNLPSELSVHIFSFFTLGQLARACLVSALWRCVASGMSPQPQPYPTNVAGPKLY